MPDWLTNIFTPDALTVIAVIALVLAVLGGIAKRIAKAFPIIKKVSYFFEDWFGEPARGTVEARPGVIDTLRLQNDAIATLQNAYTSQAATLKRVEDEQAAQGTKLEVVRHEVEHNGGGSLKDASKRTEDKVKELESSVTEIKDILNSQQPSPTVAIEVHK